jgi:hypothetical protein
LNGIKIGKAAVVNDIRSCSFDWHKPDEQGHEDDHRNSKHEKLICPEPFIVNAKIWAKYPHDQPPYFQWKNNPRFFSSLKEGLL